MGNKFHCEPTYHNGLPHYDYCRSPIACGGFGYCRNRNFDDLPVDAAGIARRRAESEAANSTSTK